MRIIGTDPAPHIQIDGKNEKSMSLAPANAKYLEPYFLPIGVVCWYIKSK